ncbi:MAG: nickel pincer cofactor biosynthesis protein LarB [Methanobrevibacter sp.]|uniref:Nickel pincer cofactor biosynthesis protein LarB n=1 Tax=Methanobrevibacter thaueri TaxID=190975 RepID=A0A8T3V7L1_9EURY|nr:MULTISPECIES: nickel pincer cofactor biosynthesis protein LarB [Methanobrevibacter]MBE6500890.1 nickel pincer cofactor biosynthesis protein LarB [Methanobrevibacter thaueri]MBE6509104.1 nickel pincer cofactor biosynthesis protein LarB [Methanobrevibacter sp.]
MKDILERLLSGELNIDEAERLLKADNILEFDDVVQFDIKRTERTGFPEAVFSPSKDYEDLIIIIRNYLENSSQDLIITKLSQERYERIIEDLGKNSYIFDYNRRAQILIIRHEITKKDPIAKIGIITAGTSDINIAEEARVIVEEGGCEAITSYDIGVAGIHRLFPQIAHMVGEGVRAFIVCAGMEGALPSVVAGLVDVPVIAVPTSVGYGVGEGGRVALDAMLQSCAPGIAVVNIDNGFGAGVFALTIVNSD